MWLSRILRRYSVNLRDKRQPWETGYRGSSLGKLRITGKPDWPITRGMQARLRTELDREHGVMCCLASPFMSDAVEKCWEEKFGTPEQLDERAKTQADERRMPGKAKIFVNRTKPDKLRGNVGNLLHAHRTVEDSMIHLIRRTRYDY